MLPLTLYALLPRSVLLESVLAPFSSGCHEVLLEALLGVASCDVEVRSTRVFDAHRAAIVMANLCVSTGTPLGRNQWEVVSGTHRSVMKYHQDAHATFRNCEGAV